MRVGELDLEHLQQRLASTGLKVSMGPFTVSIRSTTLSGLIDPLRYLYHDYVICGESEISDYHVRVAPPSNIRRWIHPQVQFLMDGNSPFRPFPARLAFPLLEWGINWCIATRAHQFLLLHAAVVERRGRGIIFPAWPGHGKTTLCAALIHRGWRLFSDEFGLIRPRDGRLIPLPRLLPLKNESIAVIREFEPEAVIGPDFTKTRKGTVAHLRPPTGCIKRAGETTQAAVIVFPRWQSDVPTSLEPMPKSQAFLMAATNAFNYEMLGETAFRAITELVKTCSCYRLSYSNLDEAINVLEQVAIQGNE